MKSVVAAIIRYENKILLTMREDFEFWCLPGGYIEEGESVLDAVHREVLEETGLHIDVHRLAVICKKPYWRNGTTMSIFEAWAKHDTVRVVSPEVKDIGFFYMDALPYPILKEHVDYIHMLGQDSIVLLKNDILSPRELDFPKDKLRKLMTISCVRMERSEWYASLFNEKIYLDQ